MQYDLVFQGGGAKGMAFVGAMQEFEARGHSIRRLVGTSAGAINAALIAAGYTAGEMGEALNEQDAEGRPIFESFMKALSLEDIESLKVENSLSRNIIDLVTQSLLGSNEDDQGDSSEQNSFVDVLQKLNTIDAVDAVHILLTALSLTPFVDTGWPDWLKAHAGSIYSLVERGGFFSAEMFVEWLERKLNEKDERFGGATLGAFYKMTGKDVSLCVTDITGGKLLVLNHRTAPDLPLIWAVRMSMSIPLVWEPVTWQSTWGTYREGHNETVLTDHLIVDGGALSNFALRLTTSAGPAVRAVMADNPDITDAELVRFNAQAPTVGFMLDGTIEVPGIDAPDASESQGASIITWFNENSPKANLVTVLLNTLETLMVGNDNFVIASQEDAICRLPVGGIGTLEFDMSPQRKQALIAAARQATKEFFDDSFEFIVNELFMAVGDDGKFQIGCDINGNPSAGDWIGLFKSPEEGEGDFTDGNWMYVQSGENVLDTITEANLGEYEARYYTTQSSGWFSSTYRLLKRTGPLNRVIAK